MGEVAPERIEAMKFALVYDGQKWSLQHCGVCKTPGQNQQKTEEIACLEADMKDATQRFLDGLNSDEGDLHLTVSHRRRRAIVEFGPPQCTLGT